MPSERNRPPELPDGTKPPVLDIWHRCPKCLYEGMVNAYVGVPLCPLDNTIMEPLTVIQPEKHYESIHSSTRGLANKDRTDIDWPEGYGPT